MKCAWESGRPNKERTTEMNLMHGPSFVQNHALHNICILHQAYVFFSSKTGMQSLTPDKSFRKTFGEKEDNSNRSEFQPSQNSTNWQPTVSPDENG